MALSNEALYANLTQAEITAGVTPTALTLGDFLIEVNFRMQITGPTMSGKSTFVLRLIQNREKVFKSDFKRIIYCCPSATYKSVQYVTELKSHCHFLEVKYGLPDIAHLQTGQETLVRLRALNVRRKLLTHLSF